VFIRLVALALAVFPVLASSTDIDDDDLNLARSLMRPAYDIAGLQRQLIEEPERVQDWWRERKSSYLVIRDLNGDGRIDVFMAVEPNPVIRGSGGVSCEMPDRIGEREFCWGVREIEVHYQQPRGSYRLGTRTSKVMMSRDEGGTDPDPFKGFTVTPKGSIRIHFSGGGGGKWESVYTVQFRKDDVYVIGTYEYSCNGARDDVECSKADANLLTGRWAKETWSGDGENRRVRKGFNKTMRPYRLKHAFVGIDPCAPPPRPDFDSNKHASGGPREGFSCDQSAR
jgi:hypothetical protein